MRREPPGEIRKRQDLTPDPCPLTPQNRPGTGA